MIDEQTIFRKDRSWEEHVFTLKSITQSRDSIFAQFIDLQKPFDTTDRDLLRYNLFSRRQFVQYH